MTRVHTRLKVLAFCAATLSALPLATVSPAGAQVTHKSIPLDGGGWFSGFAMHSSGRLYGFGDVYGAWRSDNAGETWSYLNKNFTVDDNFVTGMAVARGNADLVSFRSPSRFWRSTDGGSTWTATLDDLGYIVNGERKGISIVRGASPIMYRPNNDQEIWLASRRVSGSSNVAGTLWRSTNGGATGSWSKVGGTTFDNVEAVTIYVRPEFPNQIWVGTKSGVYVSVNGGTDFTPVWTGSYVKAIVRNSKGIVYFAAGNGGFVVTSSDSTWNNPGAYTVTRKLYDYDTWSPEQATVLADDRFISGGPYSNRPAELSMAISDSNGNNWGPLPGMNLLSSPRPIWSPPIVPGQKLDFGRDFIVQDPNNHARWFATGGFAPAITENWGQDWKFVPNNGGLAGVMTQKVNFTRTNPNMALIPAADLPVHVVTDGGASGNATASSNRDIGKLMAIHEVMSNDNGSILVGAGVEQAPNRTMIVRSTNSGANWVEVPNSGPRKLPANYQGITRSAMNPANSNDFLVVLGSGNNGTGGPSNPGMWRTTDGGQNFDKITDIPDGLDTGSRYHPENSFLLVDGQNPSTRYFACRPLLIYRSTNNGQNWTPMTSPWSNAWIMDLAVDRATQGKLWAAGGWAGVLTSDNGGASWYHVGSSWPVSGFTQAKLVDAANGQVAVFGRREGDTWDKIYWSPDNGATWSEATGPNNRYAFTKGVAVDPWVRGKLWVSGISVNVITGLPGSTTPTPAPGVSINAGGGANGSFGADNYYSGGTVSSTTATISTTGVANAAPAGVYQNLRYGNLNYTIPGLTAGATYTVRLHFAEYYWSAAGQRKFNVSINNTQVLSNFDIIADSGRYKAVVKSFNATANASGQVVVALTTVTDNATISGIEVVAGGSTTPPPTSNDVTYDFSDNTGDYTAVNGIHGGNSTIGGINFGDGVWGAGNYFGFYGGWFWDNTSDNRTFTLPSGTRLKSIKLSTSFAGSTWSISDGVNPTRSGEFLSADTPITVNTNWTNPGSNVKITFGATWDSGIDDIVYGQ